MDCGNDTADVAVLGGGPGGYVAALEAARRGARVTLVEKNRVGGVCLNAGCIPTKALATSADLLVRVRRAGDFGLDVPQATVHLPGLMQYKSRVVDQLVAGVEQLLRAGKVSLVRGQARLARPDTLVVQDVGGIREVRARQVVLAPGSQPSRPPVEGCDLPGVVDSTGALTIDRVPERFVVIGGGIIGLEFACIYEALGSKVTVLEMVPTVLPGGVDEPIARRLQVLLRRRGLAVRTGVTVERVEQSGEALRVWAREGDRRFAVEGDRVLVATGRRPNTAGMGFAEAGLRMNGPALVVDERLRTNVPGVWAIGDAVGGWMLAHKAMVEGRVAGENVTGGSRRIDHRAVPYAVFTRPEVAGVGLTDSAARRAGADVKVVQMPVAANPKARILGEAEGLVRLVCEEGSGRLLGVHLMGPHATDLIAEGALAVQAGLTADDLAWTTHAHPTLPEAMLEAALGFRDAAVHAHVR